MSAQVKDILNNNLGAAFLGVVGSAILFGITNLQGYIYYTRYPRDWWVYRVSVGTLWVLDALHLGLTIAVVYHYLIENFGNVLGLLVIVQTFKIQVAVNVVVICMVQSLYALRVWKLGRHQQELLPRIIPYFVSVVVVGGYAVGSLLAVFSFRINSFPQLPSISWVVDASFATSTGIDVVITGAMTFYLQRSRGSFAKTNSKITSLINYTLGSGLATSACSLASLVTFVLMPDNLIFMAIEFLLTKLYINSFIAMLNARQSIRSNKDDGLTLSLPTVRSVGTSQPISATETDKTDIALSPISPRREHREAVVVVGHTRHVHEEEESGRDGKPVFQWPPRSF